MRRGISCFFYYTATTEIYTSGHTLSLHDALPICWKARFSLIFPGPPTISSSALPCRYRGPMSDNTPSLDDLRRQIDEIDDAIHDLLMRLTELARQTGPATGQGSLFMRPGREARVLLRPVARHPGPSPTPVAT